MTTGMPAPMQALLLRRWIDSLIKRLDDARYARKFTPRKPDSKWLTYANRKRYAEMKARDRLTPAGLKRAPTESKW